MRIGIIAGRYLFPVILAREIKKKLNCFLLCVCFRGETSRDIIKYSDKTYWIRVGDLKGLTDILLKENISRCIMAGQISPRYIFNNIYNEHAFNLIEDIDFRPHKIFTKIISYLENLGIEFLDSTIYLEEYLSNSGVMNNLEISEVVKKDIEFGKRIISEYVKLDIGQTVVVKNRAVIAVESLEGTNNTIKRGYKIAGRNLCVLKFSKPNQDMRFDIPVVGIYTIKLLKKIKAGALVLENQKVLILEKERFLSLAEKYKIPVIGEERVS